MNDKGFRTNIIHSGEVDFMKKVYSGVAVPKVAPIYMSSVFSFDDVPTLDKIYDGTAEGYVYARMTNPGTDGVCEVLAAAEGCDGAVAFSSGMAAIITSFLSVVKPMELGADISVYSTTKFLGGHSDIIGGAICANKEDLVKFHKMSTLYGNIMSPFDAWLLARSLKTLEMRVKLHSENALKVAEFFEKHPKIERVYYCLLYTSDAAD